MLVIITVVIAVALMQMSKIGVELKNVANQDIALTEISALIKQYQLEKSVLFERALRIAEEIGFENVSRGRKKYLLNHALLTQKGFNKFAGSVEEEISKGKKIINQSIGDSNSLQRNGELKNAQDGLSRISKEHKQYDHMVEEIFTFIKTGNYQLSFEDIRKVEKEERDLNEEQRSLLDKIHDFTNKSLAAARHEERIASKFLRLSIIGSVVIGMIFSLSLIKSISKPLKSVIEATHQIGQGHFGVNLDEFSDDEIGDVSKAINRMSRELDKVNSELENKNQMLAKNLKVLDSQKKDLERVNAELDSFVYMASHDLRAPLRGMASFAAFLDEDYKDKFDKEGREYLSEIRKGATRLSTLIEDLLTLTRITRIKNPYEHVLMNSLIDNILQRIKFDIDENNVEIKIQKNIPEIICDKIKMGEVILNLVNNAIKFSSKDKKKRPIVEIGYKSKDQLHEFFVKDNGIGIEAAYHEQVFGIFRRLNKSSDYDGTGAGLNIVKRIIDEHGGDIWIESEEGKGACFYFTIPKNLEIKEDV